MRIYIVQAFFEDTTFTFIIRANEEVDAIKLAFPSYTKADEDAREAMRELLSVVELEVPYEKEPPFVIWRDKTRRE